MPEIRHIYTDPNAVGSEIFLIIELVGGTQLAMTRNTVESLGEDGVNSGLYTWRTNNGSTIDVGVHINRDGSLCIWTGSPPDVWPEDEA